MEHEREEHRVQFPTGRAILDGDIRVPPGARGLVVFVHGSGSSRHSPRNRRVAHELHEAGLATLLLDLLTSEEEVIDQYTGRRRFSIGLLTYRIAVALDWVAQDPATRDLRTGLLGTSTGAAAALVTAAQRPGAVAAVVSRGGRPDLAGDALPRVEAPTRLIVGGSDIDVLDLNRQAYARLRCEKDLAVVPGATHRFEEPGAMDEVSRQAREWFERHLPNPPRGQG